MIDTAGSIGAILAKLDNVRPTGDCKWSARCPSHDDNHNSLCVSLGGDGRVLLHCQAGCAINDVLAASGLAMGDLFQQSSNGHATGNGKPIGGRIVETYPFYDAKGELLYQSVRREPKGFYQRRPNPEGGWINNLNGTPRVLFRLPELLAAEQKETIWISEGEKDVLALVKRGFVATCNVGGAGKWKADYSKHLKGRRCIVLPDNDEPGRKHAEQVAASLRKAGAASVKVLKLPGLPEKGDVSDWLAAGGTIERLEQLAGDCPEWQPEEAQPSLDDINAELSGGDHESDDPLGAIATESASNIPGIDRESGRTEAANARRLVALHGETTRYCDQFSKWLHYDGKRWAIDLERVIDAKAKDVGNGVCQNAAKLIALGAKKQTDLIAFMRSTNSARGIRAMIDLARCELPIGPAALDADPWALNCLNGTVDLRTGNIRPHRREDFLTKLCPVQYDLDADCPIWRGVLTRIMGGNAELIGFLHRMVGYSICGLVREHVMPFCYGTGANGKSLFLGTVLECLGADYAMKAPPDLLMVKHGESHPTERADLAGKRFVACIEAEDGRRLAEGLVKEITGGDKVRARRMREDFWEFTPSHTVWLAANHKPIVRGADLGIWRRVKLIPFSVTIPDAEQDKELPEKLRAEFPGILAWMVRGCLDWQAAGLAEPNEVKAATAEYRSAMDVIGTFLDECCDVGDTLKIKASALREAYARWCDQNGELPMSGRRLGEALRDRGIRSRTSNGTWYDGVDLKMEPLA